MDLKQEEDVSEDLFTDTRWWITYKMRGLIDVLVKLLDGVVESVWLIPVNRSGSMEC